MMIQEPQDAVDYTREQVENLLDNGRLQVLMSKRENRWWTCRRNGKTKTWKRDSSRWEIPAKAGFRATFTIGRDSVTLRVAP